ncbi:MAG: endonuclease III [Candidatus Aenigmarchaeota archaeon]|nr:endonuclease III [Candidatus Aenigmarchaeota archaeon]
MKNVVKIIKLLNEKYKIKVWREEPFKLLIGTILSQRTRDEKTSQAWQKLFSKANTPEKILKLSEKEIEKLIKEVGFYRQKARRIKQVSKIILEKYKGKVPRSREELMNLPGVGPKTADIVLSYSFGKPVIAVDTHVATISKRLGWTKNDEPEKIREDLHKIIPKKYRLLINSLFVEFGKDICRSKPKCYNCPILKFCKYEQEITTQKGKKNLSQLFK